MGCQNSKSSSKQNFKGTSSSYLQYKINIKQCTKLNIRHEQPFEYSSKSTMNVQNQLNDKYFQQMPRKFNSFSYTQNEIKDQSPKKREKEKMISREECTRLKMSRSAYYIQKRKHKSDSSIPVMNQVLGNNQSEILELQQMTQSEKQLQQNVSENVLELQKDGDKINEINQFSFSNVRD